MAVNEGDKLKRRLSRSLKVTGRKGRWVLVYRADGEWETVGEFEHKGIATMCRRAVIDHMAVKFLDVLKAQAGAGKVDPREN